MHLAYVAIVFVAVSCVAYRLARTLQHQSLTLKTIVDVAGDVFMIGLGTWAIYMAR